MSALTYLIIAGVEEGGFAGGGVGSFKKLTAPSCTEPALPRRIRYGHRSWCVILVRMARRKVVS